MDPIEVVKRYEATWDTTNAADMPGFFTPGGTYTPAGEAPLTGQTIADYADAVFKAFPDSRMPITKIFASRNNVCVEWEYSATMTGDYGPFKATNKSFRLVGCHVVEVEGDKLKSVISRWDRLEMLQQLGLM
ncbi:MAG TPA: ester cyclase [Acidimicrobiia bacterium]|nr:ester cyclase [Acidimicrobiia bacterium]HMC80998.1 ester cyclase [Acidimicrobiia bacterium]